MRVIAVLNCTDARDMKKLIATFEEHGVMLSESVCDVTISEWELKRIANNTGDILRTSGGYGVFFPLCSNCQKKAFALNAPESLLDRKPYFIV